VYTSPQFQPSADTFSDKYAFVGPSVRPATSHIKKESEKLVYISMGTVNNDMMKFYKNCISAFENTNYQVIMSVGNLVNIEDLGDLPENISVYSHVDQIGVLTQADAFLTHCGMNSVNESLYYQVPLIMYPQTAEQGGVATRVSQLGAGISLEKNNPAVIREAVQQVLENPSYREKAIIISDGLKKCTGAKGAADKILQVLNN
jgi:MGT family glycosyltransferase